MDLPRLLPWLNWEEWNKCRELLYSPNVSDVVAGLNITRMWRSRGKVPHAVDATAQLVEAALRDPTYFYTRKGTSTSFTGMTIAFYRRYCKYRGKNISTRCGSVIV